MGTGTTKLLVVVMAGSLWRSSRWPRGGAATPRRGLPRRRVTRGRSAARGPRVMASARAAIAGGAGGGADRG